MGGFSSPGGSLADSGVHVRRGEFPTGNPIESGTCPDPEQYLQFSLLPPQTQGFIYVTGQTCGVLYRR